MEEKTVESIHISKISTKIRKILVRQKQKYIGMITAIIRLS